MNGLVGILMASFTNMIQRPFRVSAGSVLFFAILSFLMCGCYRDKQREVCDEYLKRCEAMPKKAASEITGRVSVVWYKTKYDFRLVADGPSTVSVVDTVFYKRKMLDIRSQTTLDVKESLSVSNLFAYFFSKQYVRHFSFAMTVPTITWYDRNNEPFAQCLLLSGPSPDDSLSRNQRELYRILEQIGANAYSFAVLKSLLESEQPHIRLAAVQRLFRIAQTCHYPPDVRKVCQLLEPLVNDPDGSVGVEIAFVLHVLQNGNPDRRGVFIEHLRSKDPFARERAATHLGGVAYSRPDNVIHALLLALQDEDTHVRYAAAGSLDGGYTNQSTVVIQALTHALTDQELQVRCMAVRALGSYGAAARGAIPELNQLLKEQDPTARQMAKTALACIQNASSSPAGGKDPPTGTEK